MFVFSTGEFAMRPRKAVTSGAAVVPPNGSTSKTLSHVEIETLAGIRGVVPRRRRIVLCVGVYADWPLDWCFGIKDRVGHVVCGFDYSSQAADVFGESPVGGQVGPPAGLYLRTGISSAWYAGLTASPQITECVNCTASVGHEIEGESNQTRSK
jgi:hypothetical protein